MKYSEVTLEEVIKHTDSADTAAVTACQKRWDSICKTASQPWLDGRGCCKSCRCPAQQ